MRRVVVTGLGIVSSIGNNADEVTDSLRNARSGIVAAEDYIRLGFRSQVHGSLKINLDEVVDRRARRFQGDGAGYCWVAMTQAIADAGLAESDVSNPRTGLDRWFRRPQHKSHRRRLPTSPGRTAAPSASGPFAVPKSMASTCSANLSTWFKTKGYNYSISARPVRPRPTASAMPLN